MIPRECHTFAKMNVLLLISSRSTRLLRSGAGVAVLVPAIVVGQVQVLTRDALPNVFGGDPRQQSLLVRNATSEPAETDARFQLVQTSSSTATPLSVSMPWKKLRVLAGQTVVESASVTFPEVRAPTRFLVLWTDANGRRLGETAVKVYPADLLSELRPLSGGKPVGVLDPLNQLKPLLRRLGIEIEDLERRDLEFFDGTLAIL